MKSARDLYGSRVGELAFVVGPGPSVLKAVRWLSEPHPMSYRIAINAAITKVPADYWLWIDGLAYDMYKAHPNARAAIRLGRVGGESSYADDPEVYGWEPAKTLPDDVQALKILHRGTSLIAAINMAAIFGSPRIVIVGCDNTFTEEYNQAKLEEINRADPERKETIERVREFNLCTILRVNRAIREMPFWLPKWVTVRDASGGDLPLLGTSIIRELEMLEAFYAKHSKPVLVLPEAV